MRLIIVGAGGHGQAVREVASALRKYVTADGNENILFLDDRYRDAVNKEQRYGTVIYKIAGMCNEYQTYINPDTEFYPAFGDNKRRLEWKEKIVQAGGKLATIIKSGTVVFPKAIINTGCIIGNACIINMGAIVDHGCVLDDACHINSGAIVMAENNVPKYTKVDSGEVIEVRKWRD